MAVPPGGDIFPASVRYDLPAATVSDLTGVSLQAARVGIAGQSSCADGTDAAAARLLNAGGCQALLRATYTDESATYVMTVGVAVLPGDARAAAAQAAMARAGAGSALGPGVHAMAFAGPWPARSVTGSARSRRASRPARTSSCTPPGTRMAGPGSRSGMTRTRRAR